jgi:hypothetical protein
MLNPMPRSLPPKFGQANQKNQRKGNASFTRRCGSRGTLIHFIVDNGSQKNLISTEFVKQDEPANDTTHNPTPSTRLHQGRDLYVSQQCRLSYGLKPFKDEVLCDISPLEFCDVLLGQPYLWKRHVVYESIPRSVIITLGRQLYKIPLVAPPTAISLISAKQCSKVISQTRKFVLFVIPSHSKQKVAATSMASTQCLYLQQKKVDGIVEEYKDIFISPTRVTTHCQVKHLIDLTPDAPLPNGPVY